MSVIRRARPEDLAELLPMIEEFYEIDRHPFDRERVLAGRRSCRMTLTGRSG